MSTNIYVLKLQNGNYYVGKSNNVERRYQEHLNGTGSAWTKKFKPFAIEKVIKNASVFDEDKTLKEYMLKYGIGSVRGGCYNSIVLSEQQLLSIKRELWGVQEKCCRCGRDSHWEKDCFATKDVDGKPIDFDFENVEVWECEYCDKEFDSEKLCEIHEKVCSVKKGIDKQHIDFEYEVWACEYCDEEFDSEGMCEIHEKVCDKNIMECNVCKKTFTDLYFCITHSCKEMSNCCYRCGRNSHYVQDCSAKTHIKGYPL